MKSNETPKWFLDALAQKPEIKAVKIKGSKISYNCWGEKNKPGLIFVHGGMALPPISMRHSAMNEN